MEANTGPVPIVIKTTSEIREQRLAKKVEKLKKARDFWKKEYDALKYIFDHYPYMQSDWEKYQEKLAKSQRLRDYDKLVPLLEHDNDRLRAENEKLQDRITVLVAEQNAVKQKAS